ncbi:MAG TPA: tetratricopeptide repeat protein [Gemmatimonadaceae bacterium]|nr:tetratricopeptide repeat protein [Gemmatimonadaceae bacterium]
MKRFVLVLAACLTAANLGAQKPAKIPKRPELFPGADTNSWHAYFQLGLSNLSRRPQVAADAFYWAARIDPRVPEPLYGQWVAFWKKEGVERYFDYLLEQKGINRRKDVQYMDSLRDEALRRNPMLYQGHEIRIIEELLPLQGLADSYIYGVLAYGGGQMPQAAKYFAQAAKDKKNLSARYYRALVLYQLTQYDSAATELETLLAELRKREAKKLVRYYESKEMLEFAIGTLMLTKGDLPAAREAFGRAATENLSFSVAHSRLGLIALTEGDTTMAMQELEQAVQLDSLDINTRLIIANILLMKGRAEEARQHYQKIVEREPWFADPYYPLAFILEYEEKREEAAKAYEAFAQRAMLTDPRLEKARAKVAELRAAKTGGGGQP